MKVKEHLTAIDARLDETMDDVNDQVKQLQVIDDLSEINRINILEQFRKTLQNLNSIKKGSDVNESEQCIRQSHS